MTSKHLGKQQQQAFDICANGTNLFVTGPGGSGKTHLIRTIVDYMKSEGKEVQVCALTGCAAVLLECGAKTVHSWAGIGLASGDSHTVIDRVCRNRFKKKPWKKVDLLIIDEISMMSKKLFDILDAIGRKARGQPFKPFGGLQLLFCGDFYQLPPVGDQGKPDSSAFCFESDSWEVTFPEIVLLRTVYRQSDALYIKILNQIRRGKLSRKSYEHLQKRVCDPPEGEGTIATQLVPRRREADAINREAMDKLDGEVHVYTLRQAKDVQAIAAATATARNGATEEAELNYLRNNVIVGQRLELKVGAEVMCVANIDMEGPQPIVNGSRGVVQEFRDGLPLVAFRDGQARIIGRHTWPSESIPSIGVEQIPLIHAWAITIHKSQGVTLDQAEIDAGSAVFECGQTYVALSRVKSLEGLYLTALDPARIRVNRKVQGFYTDLCPSSFATRKKSIQSASPEAIKAIEIAVSVAQAAADSAKKCATHANRVTRICGLSAVNGGPVKSAGIWQVEEDELLWKKLACTPGASDKQTYQKELGEIAEHLCRGEGAVRSRIKHLKNPSHKAFVRLHGEDAAENARNAASSAAGVARAAAAVARKVATDASGCSIGAWATQVLCQT